MFQESKYILDLNRKVLTPFGYQRIEEIHKTFPTETLRFIHESGEIQVAKHHTFIVDQNEVLACELKIGDVLETVTGKSKILEIHEGEEIELYDITLDQSEFENYWYYTDGVLSHNSGKSITTACYLAWLFNFYKDMNIGIVANRAAQAKEFLQNTKDIFSRLPIWLMQGITVWNKTNIANELGMRILTDVPSGDAFRGFSINCLSFTHHVTLRDKLTNEIITVTFGELFEKLKNENESNPAFLENHRFEILTDSGFQPFKGLRVAQNTGVRLDFDSGESIECTKDHKILTNRESNEFVKACDIRLGDEIDGRVVTKISDLEIQRFYDPVEVEGNNTYISDGFTHHNCLIVDECIHGREEVTVRDKLSKEIFKVTIEELYEKIDFVFSTVDYNNTKFTNRFEVLTSNGFKPFHGVKRVKSSDALKIKTTTKEITVTSNHKFFENEGFKEAKLLTEGEMLAGETIEQIEPITEEGYYYDLLEVEGGNHYTTSGFESSNCAFIRTSIWEEFADSIFPSQSALAWKKNIIISTAKGLNHFYEIVQKAKLSSADPNGKSTLVEVHWEEVPRYNSKGELIKPEDFKQQIINRYGRVYFEQNYGNSFVGSSDTLVSPEILSELHHSPPVETWDDMLRVYEPPEPDHTYVMGVDAAKEGKDYFAIQIIDVTSMPFRQVASANLQVDYLTMPDFLYEWGARFNTAYMIVENNEGAGQSIADMLVNHFEYPNMFYQDNKFKYPGFRTTKSSRDAIIRMLQILMNSAKMIIHDRETINEFQKFELVNDKYQASSGHDDLIMALALTLAPTIDMNNFNDFGKFLDAIRSDEILDTSSFFDIENLMFEDF